LAELPEIDKLAERRRQLLAESERHRQEMARELTNLGGVVAWGEKGYAVARTIQGWWPMLGVLGGFLITRKKGSFFKLIAKGWSWWQIGRRVAPIWRRAYEAFFSRKTDL